MGTRVKRQGLCFSAFSLLTIGLCASACIEGVVDVPEDELEAQEQEVVITSSTAISLDGTSLGLIKSATGGVRVASVVSTQVGNSPVLKKGVGTLSVEPVRMELSHGSFAAMQGWLAANQAGKAVGTTLVVSELDHRGRVVRASKFLQATPQEIVLPTFSGASKEPLAFSVSALPGSLEKGDTGHLIEPIKQPKPAAAFRFTLGKLDTKTVASISPITIRFPAPVFVGARRVPVASGPASISDFTVQLGAESEPAWSAHAAQVLADGKIDDREELSGSIEILAADMRTVLATLKLENVGITRIAKAADGLRYDATLYVENVMFESAK